MDDLYDILKDYKLHEARHISQRFQRMGRVALRSFLDDLASYGSQKLGQKDPSGLVIAPIGGSMGLGVAEDVLFYDSGFEVTQVEPNGNSVKVTVKIAADCRLGEHVAQVRCKSGISDYRTFFPGRSDVSGNS